MRSVVFFVDHKDTISLTIEVQADFFAIFQHCLLREQEPHPQRPTRHDDELQLTAS